MQLNVSWGNLINLLMIAAGIGVCGLSLLQIRKAPIPKQVRKYFLTFLWLVIGYITMHLARQLLEGQPGEVVRTVIRTVTFIEFLLSGFMTFMLTVMILYTALPENRARGIMYMILGLLAVHVIVLIISQFTDLYYSFDENNIYHRAPLYLVSNLTPLLMMVQGAYLLIRYRDKFEKRIAKAFWIYLLAPFGAMILQAFWSEVQFVIFATVGAAVNMFAVITSDLTEKYEQQQIESSRIETELSMATRIQADMLPNIFPAFPERKEFDIFASMDPAKEVGGDFYDFFLIDDDHLGLVIADVSGKGVPAALFMMASKILIQNYAIMSRSPKEALEATNKQICQSSHEDMFVTVWLGILELSTGILTAANAGHEYPVLKLPGGQFELLKDKHGFVIGGMPGLTYREYEIKLEKGAILFLYTDGVAEATDEHNEFFGTDRLLDALNTSENETPRQVLESMDRAVGAFVKKAPQFDDLTMLCIKYNGI